MLSICVLAKSELCTLTAGCLMNLGLDKELLSIVNTRYKFVVGCSDLPKTRSEQVSYWYNEAKTGELFMFIDSGFP